MRSYPVTSQPGSRLWRQRIWFQRLHSYFAIWRSLQSGQPFFQKELQQFLGCDEAWVRSTAREYLAHPQAWQLLSLLKSSSRRMDGFAKSLDVAEGFALWALVKMLKPRVVVELGVNRGISARLWKEALKTYVPDHQLVLCDLYDLRQFITDEEARFVKADAFKSLPQIFNEFSVDILHNDAHPYDLIRWSVLEAIEHKVPCLTFHDVGQGPRGPYRAASAKLSVEERMAQSANWAEYGLWERHVMAELLAPDLASKDWAKTSEWECQIFDSLFGFGVALRRPRK